jgi:hypothetical protein
VTRSGVCMETEDDFTDRIQRIKDGGLLDVLRVRTAMYTGERTLSAVCHFLHGFGFAQHVYQITASYLPPDFHDWVAYRLHFRESTSGYRRMILDRIPDESATLDRFFELLDEHRSRQASIVATVRTYDLEAFKLEHGNPGIKKKAKVAEEVRLAVYTTDPGFFVTHDDQTAEYPRRSFFCPALSWFRSQFKLDGKSLEILDRERYNRLLQEDEVFGQRLKEESEQRKRSVQSE